MDILFPPFRLDPLGERLWQGDHEIRIRPKTFAVLRYLAERPGRLVSTAELLRAMWAGNAATRIEAYVLKNGIYASGVVPEIEDLYARQARETDRKKREALVHQMQDIMHERVLHVPIYELAFLWGVGPRVEEACVDHIKGFSYSAPYEDLKLKAGK